METTETTPTQKHYAIPRYRVCVVREKSDALVAEPPKRLTDSRQVYHALRPHFADAACEEFVMICLDAKHAPIGWHIVSIGSLTLSIVHPREVFKVAVAMNSAAIILAHNHPSGEPTPSQEDRVLTQRLVEGGELLGIRVLDHVVIGDEGCYVSFADQGWLNQGCIRESHHGRHNRGVRNR